MAETTTGDRKTGKRAQQSRRGNGKGKSYETLKTWVFDSVGPRKYAVQVQKAGNGNPLLKITEGVPQQDGTYRKFSIMTWSEDFQRLFEALDEARQYIEANNITTPKGHDWRKASAAAARRRSAGDRQQQSGP